jgi:inorganic pyrophosphatase
MADLTSLPAFDGDKALRVVVESPRGSALKLEYAPEHGLFTVARSLPLGMVYPFDWGFIPGTLAADGDPVDALALHPTPSYPGVVLPCRLLGMVEVTQKDGRGKSQVNNRLIATPAWHDALQTVEDARKLPASIRDEIEQFFVSVTALTDKQVKIKGWANSRKALQFLQSCLR